MGAAFNAMAKGGGDPGDRFAAARTPPARPVRSIVIHGSADTTVAPVNAEHVLRQSMAAHRRAAPDDGETAIARPTTTSRHAADGGHAYTRHQWSDRRGTLTHELLTVEGLGHAWSGGTPGASYTDPRGPDATEAIWRFFARGAVAAVCPVPSTGHTAPLRSD
jgi:poly(3-hydroxybutyrate) depolymerase